MDPVKSGLKVKGDLRGITQIENRHGTFIIFTMNNKRPKVYKKTVGLN